MESLPPEAIVDGAIMDSGAVIDAIQRLFSAQKIKTGDVFELAEVVRNLALREMEKGLSTGEKQMYTRAKKILASELMYVLDMEEDEAETHLEELIADAHTSRNGAAASA